VFHELPLALENDTALTLALSHRRGTFRCIEHEISSYPRPLAGEGRVRVITVTALFSKENEGAKIYLFVI
jgi:hypothetical protein